MYCAPNAIPCCRFSRAKPHSHLFPSAYVLCTDSSTSHAQTRLSLPHSCYCIPSTPLSFLAEQASLPSNSPLQPMSGMSSSGVKRSFAAAAAASSRRMQSRHFHAGPTPVAGDEGASNAAAAAGEQVSTTATEAAVAPTSVASLYSHALESIFSFSLN